MLQNPEVDWAVLMSESITTTAEYNELLDSIKRTLATGQLCAARAVNNVLVETYWQIGGDIVRRQQEQRWGARVIERLSADLRAVHPNTRGLSPLSLEYMAALASRWPEPIAQQPVARLPWGHITVGKLNFYVQLVDDHLRDQAHDEPTLGMLLVVGRDDVTVEVALRGLTTPLAVTEWRRLPAKVRQALPSAEDLSAAVTRTVREIESTTAAA